MDDITGWLAEDFKDRQRLESIRKKQKQEYQESHERSKNAGTDIKFMPFLPIKPEETLNKIALQQQLFAGAPSPYMEGKKLCQIVNCETKDIKILYLTTADEQLFEGLHSASDWGLLMEKLVYKALTGHIKIPNNDLWDINNHNGTFIEIKAVAHERNASTTYFSEKQNAAITPNVKCVVCKKIGTQIIYSKPCTIIKNQS